MIISGGPVSFVKGALQKLSPGLASNIEGQLWITPLLEVLPGPLPGIPLPLPGRCEVNVSGGAYESQEIVVPGKKGKDLRAPTALPSQVTITSTLYTEDDVALAALYTAIIARPTIATPINKARIIISPQTLTAGITQVVMKGFDLGHYEPKLGGTLTYHMEQFMPSSYMDPIQDGTIDMNVELGSEFLVAL